MTTVPMGQAQIAHKQTVGNRYHLLGLLGAGGMGQVYRALDRLTGETVALKRVATDGIQAGSNAELRLALAHEFQALAGLRHPNIIGVRDYGFDTTGQPYFTMDLLHNPRTLVAAGQFAAHAQKLHLLLPVLHALAYIHRRGIIHRDLKPGNILVSGTTVKVLDFGLAAIAGQTKGSAGTLRYMAPELLRGAEATIASDLYAVGCHCLRTLCRLASLCAHGSTGLDRTIARSGAGLVLCGDRAAAARRVAALARQKTSRSLR